MSDILTARLATSGSRARTRMSQSERAQVTASREASRSALARAVESRNAAHYERTVARMQSLQTELSYAVESLARHREAGCWTTCTDDVHESVRVLRIELDAVFGTPIRQSDVNPGGRYERFIAYHMRRIASRITIGSTLITGDDARDILSLALVRAYADGALVEDERGQMVPTIGTLYRLGRAELMRTVSRARREVQTVSRDAEWHSERAEIPRAGAASLFGVDPARIDWTNRDAVKSILTPAPRWAIPPAPEDMALADRVNRRRAALDSAEAERHASVRRQDRSETAALATFGNDDSLGIDAACVSLIADGATLADIATRLYVKSETIARRLASIRFRNGAVVRLGSDGRATGKRATADARRATGRSARDVTVPEERVLISTRKRAPREPRVIPWESVPTGMRLASAPSPLPDASGIAAPRSEWHPVNRAQEPTSALTPERRHAMAHERRACNCGEMAHRIA